ncbi:type IV secretion system protein [Novosphingobium sp. HR1a]|uniref:type IV secretion system protein n=1 Tax=Novosphingobium sp. HR1a TaxID=1395637 RepID=UPI001B3C5B7D|nr:type IV secretion system protein [Novosphingobium sp. HR1a]MBF7015769.1 type IV secretion system protein VirB5 [Novosphingobium sp. HR1a]MCC4254692.1 type IV secretion system protein [Sphingobium naphthae]
MRRLKAGSIALAGSALLCAGTARAQLGTGIVFDPRAFAQQIKQLEQARQAILQGKQQIEQAQSLYRDLNKATDINNVANQLKSDMLRTSDVSSSSLDGYTNGNVDVVGGLRGKASDVYQDLIGRSSQAATESERAAYEQGAREAAVSTGLASNVGDAVTSRREGLDELRARLGNATSAAERADMSARLQLEQAQMMNDQMALQAVELQRRAKAEADYQRYVALQQSDRASFKAGMGLD